MQDLSLIGKRSEFHLASSSDLATIARIHKAAYSASHFTSVLSQEVLKNYYGHFIYGGSEILLSNNGDASQAGEDRIDGFIVYGLNIPERISEFKRRHATDILKASLTNPRLAAKKFLTVAFTALRHPQPHTPAKFLLLSIATHTKRRGIGRALITNMQRRSLELGFKTIGLYVNHDNTRAINLYFSLGFLI